MSDLGPVDPGRGGETEWLRRWRLQADGDAFATATSVLTPVLLADGTPGMLKVARVDEEIRGGAVLAAWHGHGAARVLEAQDAAVLLERATGTRSLVHWVENGCDDEATRVLCDAAGALHAASGDLLTAGVGERHDTPELVPLELWFRELLTRADGNRPTVAGSDPGFVRRAAAIARELLDGQDTSPQEVVALHGDIHHGNVLDFGDPVAGGRGWLAIDPKGLVGDRAFDYCNLLCNPSHERALEPGRLERQFAVVTDAAGLAPDRLARWLAAWCGLSSVWFALDGDAGHTASATAIGRKALALIG
ncbi:MAG: aminoglycoside phosphotransferase family protein [Leifsonia flava]